VAGGAGLVLIGHGPDPAVVGRAAVSSLPALQPCVLQVDLSLRIIRRVRFECHAKVRKGVEEAERRRPSAPRRLQEKEGSRC